MNTKDETEAVPAQNGAEDVIEVWEVEVIRYATTRMTGFTLRKLLGESIV